MDALSFEVWLWEEVAYGSIERWIIMGGWISGFGTEWEGVRCVELMGAGTCWCVDEEM